MIHDALVEIIATQEGIAAGGPHLENPFAHIQDGNVERSTAQIVHCDDLVILFVQSIRQGGSRRLVDDAQHFQPGDLAGILGGIALGIVEISRDRDDSLGDRLTEISLSIALDLGQDHGRDFRRGIFFFIQNDTHIPVFSRCNGIRDARQGTLHFGIFVFPPHETLDGEDGILCIDDGLVAGHPPHQPFMVLVHRNHGWNQPLPLRGWDHNRLVAHHHSTD